jgi:divalent metal cation (Fe/Co/Zn/Cd) transporter
LWFTLPKFIGWIPLLPYFWIYIIVVGYKIVRKSLSGIMDEQDPDLLEQIIQILEENRRTEWIDVHNMKIQQFGANLHIDAHITFPGITAFVMHIMKWKK